MPRFALDYSGPVAPLIRVVGISSRGSGVEVHPDVVKVRLGWAFRATIARTSIRAARRDPDRVLAWGVHGWRGRWLVNASSRGVVRLDIDPPARAWVVGVPVRLRTLRVGVAAPAGLLAALGAPET